MEAFTIDPTKLKLDPAREGALDEAGQLRILPHDFWTQFTQAEIGVFCVRNGFYCVPTTELVAWLQERIGERKAIEIGSGNGVLASALAIPATDNRMQEWPQIRDAYLGAQQTPVPYGQHVQEMDAGDAVAHFQPEVVVAAWVTHKWDERVNFWAGNYWGVDEKVVVQRADYIHIGNRKVHQFKPVLALPHVEFEYPWLVSRAMNGSPNYIATWSSVSVRKVA